MPEFDLSDFGLPVAAVLIALVLIGGAAAVESDANPAMLQALHRRLSSNRIAGFGAVGARLVPVLFERVFGTRLLSARFVIRSLCATTLFWLLLLAVKNPVWQNVWLIDDNPRKTIGIIAGAYLLDFVSLTKARRILKLISTRGSLASILLFIFVDMVASYLLPIVLVFLLAVINNDVPNFVRSIPDYVLLQPIFGGYVFKPVVSVADVIIPSTLLTSVWSLLILLSCMVTGLLASLDYMRRFTWWWFRDAEQRPLSAIAKVASVLVVAGAAVVEFAGML